MEGKYLDLAFIEAKKALELKEIPVGAVIVKDNEVISTGYNLKETNNNSLAHAELIAINEATKKLGNWRLIDCDIYVTLEPCEMCAAAIKQSRIRNIYCALSNDNENIHNSVINILNKDKSNPSVNLFNDLDRDRGSKLLKDFFILTREK